MLFVGLIGLAVAPTRADTAVSEKQARRAAEVAILKNQFRQQGGFTSDQLSGFYTALQLSNEINNDIKSGVTRSADYYSKRSLSINDYFHQQVLNRPTLLSDKDAALVIWKTDLLFSPLKLGPELAKQAGISDSGGIALITDAAKSTIDTAAAIYSHEFNPTKALSNKDLVSSLQTQAQQKLDNSLYTLFGKCDQAPSSCQAIDGVIQQIGRPSGLDPAIDFNILASQHADIIPQSMRVAADGNLHFDPQAQASGAMNQCLDLTQNGIKPDVETLKQESDPQLSSGFVAVVRGPEPTAAKVQAEADREKLRAAQIDLTLKAVDFSAQLIRLVNPKLANEIQTVKQATVSTAQSISGYLAEVRAFKNLGSNATITDSLKLGASSFVLAGGMVGVGFEIFSMFADSGPSADQIILQEIQKLSEQIENLRTEMNGRFDRVDSELNDVMTTLHESFAKINYKLNIIDGNVNDIRTGLISIETKLDRLEQYLSRWLQDSQKDEFVRNVNGCLNYKAKFGIGMSQSEFIRCETYFYTWVSSTALRDLWAGADRTDFSDTGVADNIGNFPLNVNINWMSQFLSKNLGLPAPISSTTLPNLFEWTLGTQAYLQLIREWPQWAASVSPSDLDTIERLGQNIQQAIANAPTAGATASSPSPLFDALLSKYKAKITALQNAIGAIEQSYIKDPSNKLQGVNLWGGGSQVVAYTPAATEISAWCDGTAAPAGLTVPNGNMFVDRYIDQSFKAPFLVAEKLGLGKIDYCLDANFDNGANIVSGRGNAHAFIYARYGGKLIVRWSTSFPNLVDPGGSGPNINLRDLFTRYWGGSCGVRSDFELAPHPCGAGTGPVVTGLYPGADQSRTDTISNVNNTLRSNQHALYGRISSEFTGSGAVNAAAKQLGGFKGLVCAYASLLLPRTMGENEYVQSLCLGSQAIFADTDVAAIYDVARNDPIPDTTKKVDFTTPATDRASALQDALKAIGTKLVQKQTDERLDLVSDVLDTIGLYKIGNSGAACAYSVHPTSLQIAAAGGSTSVTIDTASSCPWDVVGLPSWAHSTGSGPGSGSAGITVDLNQAAPRSVVLTIATQPVTLSQNGTTSCSYSINPTSQTFPAAGDSGRIDVTAGPSCAWSVTSVPSWITISGGASSPGPGNISYTVAANSGAARSASFTVAGLSFKVDQSAAATCSFSINPISQTFPPAGGSGRIDVTAGTSCTWSVASLAAWITISSGSSTTGPGPVLYAVAANSGGARSGSLTVAGLSFKVDQAASGGSSGAGLTVKDVSGTPGKPVELSILFASGGAAVSAIQFTCAYDPQIVTFVSARAGDQLLAAGKSITVTGSSGQLRAVGAGLNQNRINDGIAAFFTFNINSTFPTNGKTTVSCSNVQFVDAQGQAISATGGAGTITASTGCDVNGNGQFEIADVQLIINEALGILPPIHGRNDGKVDIVDVQIVINAVLGLGCNR